MRQREQLPWERHPPINSIVPPASSKSSMKASKLFLTVESTFAVLPAFELIVTSSARTEVADNMMTRVMVRTASTMAVPEFGALLQAVPV